MHRFRKFDTVSEHLDTSGFKDFQNLKDSTDVSEFYELAVLSVTDSTNPERPSAVRELNRLPRVQNWSASIPSIGSRWRPFGVSTVPLQFVSSFTKPRCFASTCVYMYESHASKRLCIPFHESEMLRKNIPNRAGKPVEYNNDRTVAPFRIVKEEEEGNESHEEIFPRKQERNIFPFFFSKISCL